MSHPVLPVALKLEKRPVLLVGGDAEACDKLRKLRAAGARVTVVAREADLPIRQRARRGELCWYAREFCESDSFGQTAIILTTRDPQRAAFLWKLRRRYGFLLCAIDQPDFCDFFMMALVQRGPVQIGITTGGQAPLLARELRRALERGLTPEFADFCQRFAELRSSLSSLPRDERSGRLQAALNGFAMELALRYPNGVGALPRAEEGTGKGL